MKFNSEFPEVSVFILCYNQGHLIGRAIESVVGQTYGNLQVVVVDDCSTDNSREVISEWQKKHPGKIKIYFQPQNVGHPKNMNTGYRLCDGELITYCDGDDWYFPEKVEREVEFLRQHPKYDVVYSAHDIYSIEEKFIRHWLRNGIEPMTGDVYLKIFSVDYPMIKYEMTSKAILEKKGYYDDSFSVFCDWDLWLRLASKYKFGYNDYTGSAYVENPAGITRIMKLETTLDCFKRLLIKNKPILDNISLKERKNSLRATLKNFDRIELNINTWSNRHSFRKTISYLRKYPEDISKYKMIIASLLGKNKILKISAIKRILGMKVTPLKVE